MNILAEKEMLNYKLKFLEEMKQQYVNAIDKVNYENNKLPIIAVKPISLEMGI